MRASIKPQQNLANKKTQAGILLIEVMIAVLIFSVGLLGLIGLQAVSTKNSTNAEERTRASMLANDIVSTMWVKGSLNPSAEIVAWQTLVADSTKSGLNNATGNVTVVANTATVTITWKSPSKNPTDNSNQYFTSVAMPN
jgi:type IV pilus assembly protein PilV